MNKRPAVALCFALLVTTIAPRLHGQDPRLADRFSIPVAARLNTILDSAGRDGLPAEPLVLRALEGQAKGASTEQIIAALGRLRDMLRIARTTLGTNAAATELTTAAAALQAGMPQSRLAELHKLRGALPVTAPLNAYLDLTSRGTPAEGAWNRISDLVRRRASDAEFVHLTPSDINHDVRSIDPATPPAGKETP